jgi:hypothetical protein
MAPSVLKLVNGPSPHAWGELSISNDLRREIRGSRALERAIILFHPMLGNQPKAAHFRMASVRIAPAFNFEALADPAEAGSESCKFCRALLRWMFDGSVRT